MDVLFDIHRVADSKVTIFDHHLLGNLPVLPNRRRPLSPHPFMSIRVQIHRAAQFMDFSVKVAGKRPDATSHNVNDRVRNMVCFDMFAASLQGCNIVINCLCRSNLGDINFEAVGIMKFKFVVVDFCHAIKFALIHAAVAIGFAGNMIFNVLYILMVLCELINERFITAICSEAFCADQIYMLYFLLFHPLFHPQIQFLPSAPISYLASFGWPARGHAASAGVGLRRLFCGRFLFLHS